MLKIFFLFGLFMSSFLSAASIRLQNDTPYPLRAVINGADGAFLGDILVNPRAIAKWADAISPFDKPDNPPQGPSLSQTPFTITWYCKDGTQYGICDHISTGAFVKASHCLGVRSGGIAKKEAETSESVEK